MWLSRTIGPKYGPPSGCWFSMGIHFFCVKLIQSTDNGNSPNWCKGEVEGLRGHGRGGGESSRREKRKPKNRENDLPHKVFSSFFGNLMKNYIQNFFPFVSIVFRYGAALPPFESCLTPGWSKG